MTDADANRMIAGIAAAVVIIGSLVGYKEYQGTVVFSNNHPYLASSSFNNTKGGKTEVDLRLFARDSPSRCIKIYDNINNPVTVNQLPLGLQIDMMHAQRRTIDVNLQNLGVPKPAKVTLCSLAKA